MPRPCQKRRASTAANRKPNLEAPQIRHKARQKAIHNARRGRGAAHRGGLSSRNNKLDWEQKEQDFISFADRGNNFGVLHPRPSSSDVYTMLGEDRETDDSGSEFDDSDFDDYINYSKTHEAQDMLINVDVSGTLRSRSNAPRAEVMFTVSRAVAIYKELRLAGFPLQPRTTSRYGVLPTESASLSSVSQTALAPSFPTASSATIQREELGRDYVFNFGKHSGSRFQDVPEDYTRTIGGQLSTYELRHPGLREAFEYYRPGQACSTAAVPRPRKKKPQAQPLARTEAVLPVASKRNNTQTPSDTWVFRKGPHKGKKLVDAPENYIRTLEGMPKVIEKWPGFKAALHDFNEKTGRRGKI